MNRPHLSSILLLAAALLLAGYVAQTRHAGSASAFDLPAPSLVASNLAVSQPESPLESSSRQQQLLPTVTPTLGGQAITTSPTAESPLSTVEPELYPMATPYYYGNGDISSRSGITYTTRTGAGFGHFSFNDISPCLCQSLNNTHECSREIEQYLLSAPLEGIVRAEQCLSIDLADERVITFHDFVTAHGGGGVAYTYAKSLPEIGYHLLRLQYYEGNQYLLVKDDSGALTIVPGFPIFSPDHQHFALVVPMAFFLQIWSVQEDGPRYEQGWQVGRVPYQFEASQPVITWVTPGYFRVEWPIPTGYAIPSAPLTLTVSLDDFGERVVYYDGKPIPSLVVDINSIRFATAGGSHREMLDTLQVDKPVYTDRDYRFTAIPAELEGAIYFRLPQYYYLGEAPDYFPIEAQMANYLEFQVTRDFAGVYVALDAIVDDPPDSMQSGWQAVDMKLETDDIPLRLYRKHFAVGATVGLVDKWMQEGRVPSQFVVIVTPDTVTPDASSAAP